MPKNIFKALCYSAIITTLFSCQTQEQIRREQMVDNLAIQMTQNQQLTADATVKVQNLQEQLSLLTGEIENKDYKMIMDIQKEFSGIKEQVELMQKQLEAQQKEVDKTRSQMQEQKKLLDNILKTLENLSASAAKKKSQKSLYEQTMEHYTRGRYKQAKSGLLKLEKDSKIKGNQRSRVLHNLGMIAYMDKEWSNAQGHFGRLVTQFPDAPQVPNGLYFMAKSFQEDKKKEEAKQVLEELLRRFPKAKQADQAKKMLSSL